MSAQVCLCGAEAVLKTVNKIGPNTGREFYACPNQLCRFFQWADQQPPSSSKNKNPVVPNPGTQPKHVWFAPSVEPSQTPTPNKRQREEEGLTKTTRVSNLEELLAQSISTMMTATETMNRLIYGLTLHGKKNEEALSPGLCETP